jgi:hypothetical protein
VVGSIKREPGLDVLWLPLLWLMGGAAARALMFGASGGGIVELGAGAIAARENSELALALA